MVAANQKELNRLLKTAREDRYCIDVANQLLSVEGLIKKSRRKILHSHLEHCVKNAQDEKELEVKILELEKLLERME